jgi:hypothetical protein
MSEMSDIKRVIYGESDNGLSFKQLDDIKIGDVYEYRSDKGTLRHYIVSYLFKSTDYKFAVILFPDGYAETIKTEHIKRDKYIETLPDWSFITMEYPNERNL